MLLNACMSAAPGQKECDNALRNIQVRFAIDDPVAFCWYCTLKQNLVFWVWFNHFFFHHVFAFLLLFFFCYCDRRNPNSQKSSIVGAGMCAQNLCWKNHKMKLFQQYYCILPFVVQYFSTPLFEVWASLHFSTLGTEMDNPSFSLQAVSNILDNPVEPVNSDTFFDCLDKVTHRSQVSMN